MWTLILSPALAHAECKLVSHLFVLKWTYFEEFVHTGHIESFNNLQLKYANKKYSYKLVLVDKDCSLLIICFQGHFVEQQREPSIKEGWVR